MWDASCRDWVLVEHRGDFPPAVDPAQLDLSAYHEPEEQDQPSISHGAKSQFSDAKRSRSASASSGVIHRLTPHTDTPP
jgi:hypothetical protein